MDKGSEGTGESIGCWVVVGGTTGIPSIKSDLDIQKCKNIRGNGIDLR